MPPGVPAGAAGASKLLKSRPSRMAPLFGAAYWKLPSELRQRCPLPGTVTHPCEYVIAYLQLEKPVY